MARNGAKWANLKSEATIGMVRCTVEQTAYGRFSAVGERIDNGLVVAETGRGYADGCPTMKKAQEWVESRVREWHAEHQEIFADFKRGD